MLDIVAQGVEKHYGEAIIPKKKKGNQTPCFLSYMP